MTLYSLCFKFEKISGVFADVNYNYPKDNLFDVPSLKELCAFKLLSNVSLLLNAHITIPPQLKELLMYKALNIGDISSIKFLLKSWPYENLYVPLPEISQTCNIYTLHTLDSLLQLSMCISVILLNFIQPLSSLKYLDLSALPLDDTQISIISSLAMTEISDCSDTEFVIYINCLLRKQESLEKLYSVFVAQKDGPRRVKLVMKALHISPNVCCVKSISLIRLLNTHELEQFGCDFCFEKPIPQEIFNVLKDFHCLKALSLQCVGPPCMWKPLLNELVNLERLDLTDNRIADKLEYSLSGMYQKTHQCCSLDNASVPSGRKLRHLNLARSFLTDESIIYLARSLHSMSLSYLNLSCATNVKLTNLVLLLKACKNLNFLELQNCGFDEHDVKIVFEALQSLIKLKYLNISLKLSPDHILSVAPLICEIPNLTHLQIIVSFQTMLLHFAKDAFIEQLKQRLQRPAPLEAINLEIKH